MKHRIVSFTLLVVLLVSLCVGAASCNKPSDEPFDYIGTDLTTYITLPPESYRDLAVSVLWDEVTEAQIDEQINAILVSYRAEAPSNNGAGVTDAPITLGDEVYIYFHGYSLDEQGNKVPFDGGSNLTSTSSSKVTVGKGEFVSGFESALLGKIPAEMTCLKTSGRVSDGDYVTVTYFAVNPDKTYGYRTDTFCFAASRKEQIDAAYGTGFYDAMCAAEIEYGTNNEHAYIASATFPKDGGEVVYQDIVFKYGTTGKPKPIVAQAYFPADYSEPSLQAKTMYFDLYLDAQKAYVIQYDTPELNETFLLADAKVDVQELEQYAGDTLVEKYRSKVRALLEGDSFVRREEYDAALLRAVLPLLAEKATIHTYPSQAVAEQVALLEVELDYWVEQYVQYGYTADRETIAKMVFGYTTGTYIDYFDSLAKEAIAGTLALYQFAKQENLLLQGDALAAAEEAAKDELLALSLTLSQNKEEFDRKNFGSDAEYQAAIAAFREEMVQEYTRAYGETYFEVYAQEQAIVDALSQVLDITVIGQKN